MTLPVLLSFSLAALVLPSAALRYEQQYIGHNLNENETAIEAKDFWGIWDNHTFQPSPANWRMPTFVLTIDRFIDGNPTNNDANGTVFENNWMANQFRFGGDTAGVYDNLDYLEGMGIKTIYFTGSMMLNMPWSPDGYGPLDLTLLDAHHGLIEEWRTLIDEIHRRGMYAIFDNTVSTMGDLLAYGDGYTNTTAEFRFQEYDYIWKGDTRYHDFQPGNDVNESCQYPRIWEQNGYLEADNVTEKFRGCRASEFDMYGDIKGTGAYPSYVNQLSRFASVQDRLREWMPDVLEKINRMSCLQITMLDIDGFRIDKAVQVTIDALAEFSHYQRECARSVGKDNFLVVGEVVADPRLAAVYFGRGKQPDQQFTSELESVSSSNETDPSTYVRPLEKVALNGAAFHYDVYGSMTRFLGLDGPWGSLGVDWASIWNHFLVTQDMVNPNTGAFDPLHMFGTTNQDVFRWPSLADGTARQLLGLFVTTLELPGAPMMYYGEEQDYYVLENLAPDYVYGRTPYGSSRAWQLHGCYDLGEELYVDMPFNSSKYGCYDDGVSLDHRDPSHPNRNFFKRLFELRDGYPTLNDGYNLTNLATWTQNFYLPGSNGMPSPTGLWSVYRGRSETVQDFAGTGFENQGVWLLFHNNNESTTYFGDCSSMKSINGSILSPFAASTTVRNLFYPYESYTLEESKFLLGIENSTELNGCLPRVTLDKFGFKALVPADKWLQPKPVITGVTPMHDQRLSSEVAYTETEQVPIEIRFSQEMDCDSVANSLIIGSTAQGGRVAELDNSTIVCGRLNESATAHDGYVGTAFTFKATLQNVANGIHTYTVVNASTADKTAFTNTRDRFQFRIGQSDNPMVFPLSSNYTTGLLQKDDEGGLFVRPRAAGADLIRYSTNWGSSWSSWSAYSDNRLAIKPQAWSGTSAQNDLESAVDRRWPHAWVQGVWNQWGYDEGLTNEMRLAQNSTWTFDLYGEYPSDILINVWGMNPDGNPDKSAAFGDIDRDGVLDWLNPTTIARNVINISSAPAHGIGYRIVVNDGNYSLRLVSVGSVVLQAAIILMVCLLPIGSGILGALSFAGMFYGVKLNKLGTANITKGGLLSNVTPAWEKVSAVVLRALRRTDDPAEAADNAELKITTGTYDKSILIATIEYEIPRWSVKVKIGGLGAMASLQAKTAEAREFFWVVPCFGDIEYPFSPETMEPSIEVAIEDVDHTVHVHLHSEGNVTYVLLDTPAFRARKSAEPYPPRMDDTESAFYYSIWNQSIAAFQGLWSLKEDADLMRVCEIFNLDVHVVNKYVRFGDVFNLLHAGVSYLREHQDGFGAVGVSDKYSQRTKQRYPIFWSINKIGSLPNPDPTDMAAYVRSNSPTKALVDESFEEQRAGFRQQAQEWAGLDVNPNADLFIFIGRWSKQKGVDVIADVFPAILAKYPSTQLICVGPVIDLYGKFAALKLEKLMDMFPGRVYSKPEFTAIPPYIHKGAEFALMPSRDEPFGLVAVEFGRKGALCIGARVGGFGNMPGWWFPVESMTTEHMIKQCRRAILAALGSDQETRRSMRACCGTQRFPVQTWLHDLKTLHLKAMEKSANQKVARRVPALRSMTSLSSLRTFGSPSPALLSPTIRSPATSPVPLRCMESAQSMRAALSPSPTLSPGVWHQAGNGSRPTSSQGQSYFPRSGTSTPDLIPADLISRTATPAAISTPPMSRSSSMLAMHSQAVTERLMPLIEVSGSAPRGDSPEHGSHELLPRGLPRSPSEMSLRSEKQTPMFDDSKMRYYQTYSRLLDDIARNGPFTSSFGPAIEEYIVKSEQDWFEGLHQTSLGMHLGSATSSTTSLVHLLKSHKVDKVEAYTSCIREDDVEKDFYGILGEEYTAPTGLRKVMLYRLGSWHYYTLVLAAGQILCANPYQLVLLTGQVGAPASKLYTLCAVYLTMSAVWWTLHRFFRSVYLLSAPFVFFGLAFVVLACSSAVSDSDTVGHMWTAATCLYTTGSAAYALFFALNFGTEAGMAAEVWAWRACVMTGLQQLLISFMWYWGSFLTQEGKLSTIAQAMGSTKVLVGVGLPLAAIMWILGAITFFGLPDCYRQPPGVVPSFYRSLLGRPLVLWFLAAVVLQCFWLSTNYTRNWMFLWSSNSAPKYAVALLVIIFFGFFWFGLMAALINLSKRHAWIVPIFAISLGAPRWCQMLWSLSGVGNNIPWAATPALGALLSRAIWLWLGVLDGIQGVGMGAMLLMSLTRVHTLFTLILAQMAGAAVTMLARAIAPHRTGPLPVFPNLAAAELRMGVWFWVGLVCQLLVCVGFLKLYRKSQLQKP
ncbi:Cell wall alpha-1,3-glucan synthase mok11 [Cyphellophora attinorum]|uniref:alpha-1,3-glucan synthase n=1 Tax=Cyphellophora attinorum TaxID=1664694 RepID=A0A0N1H582_9EURO|nr:Cell wall alpha-1,3-glucan synthase mok11 [Phialophora attinorum]KPI40742.1 Cell wall alpha-1,3-glucan synthase mok11 [Phialophora attinorum]